MIAALGLAPQLQAGVVAPYTDCKASVREGVLHLDPLPNNRPFAAVLDRFSIETRGPLEPPAAGTTYLLKGRIVSDNTGLPEAGIPISVRVPGQAAHWAARSNAKGEFSFQVQLERGDETAEKDESARLDIYLPSLEEAELMLGGVFEVNRTLVSGIVSKFRLEELAAATGMSVIFD